MTPEEEIQFQLPSIMCLPDSNVSSRQATRGFVAFAKAADEAGAACVKFMLAMSRIDLPAGVLPARRREI